MRSLCFVAPSMDLVACRTLWVGVCSQASSRGAQEALGALGVAGSSQDPARFLSEPRVPPEKGGHLCLHLILPPGGPPGGGFITLQVVM